MLPPLDTMARAKEDAAMRRSARKARVVIGLNSGTSADGVDAVACEIAGRGLSMRVGVIGHVHRDYSPSLRKRVLAVMAPAATTTEEVCRLESELGDAFADAAAHAVKALALRRVDFIGSHGQTICHLPPRKGMRGTTGTLQIGDASRIAARIGCPVVHHFRQADMAVGGQGAPLVPWTDYVLFREPKRTRVIQNIGGIANLTYLPAGGGPDSVIAFDTGPGNMVIDSLVRHFTKGREHYDADGRWAIEGQCDEAALRVAMHHRFFREPPPRSCGREEFGESWVQAWRKSAACRRLSKEDLLRTATCLTAFSIVSSCVMAEEMDSVRRTRHRPPARPISEIVVCGGGANNLTLMMEIETAAGLALKSEGLISRMDDYGIAPGAKEGVSFAMLAAARMDGVPANLPHVTGARRAVVLGSVCVAGGGH
ncbi:MAG: anhydro-N-acetylmuramic acid kinase [Planctomycetes bacterium]|nr:anhydro-N-acetylmuramic acid kinase [Planctomycetota bacterium]